ncbi:C2H2 type zinc-finger-domain-containing protein [Scheffersomyces xylosifermentans]|uniref:C2H2 type zinc-finger-domain-containing protein n=1 Tax=Scheffersomyces xylosifermentans TaxID=1304137 RepID=UPI00315DAC04
MFTCNTCSLTFPTAEDQRIHMKSEWHRYNLKRRVAQLPAIDEDLFNTKVASLTIEDSEEPAKKKGEKQVTKKEQRRREKEALQEKKREILETAKRTMLAQMRENGTIIPQYTKQEESSVPETKPEQETTVEQEVVSKDASVEQPENKELTAEEEEQKLIDEKMANKIEITPTTCLFSHPKYNKVFATVDENIEHMWKNFGLYIPEQSYLVDKEGLLSYLAEKVSFGFCIACNYQGRNAEAAREHMKQKRHMRIPYETEDEKLEISQFYDFSSTYDNVPATNAVATEGNDEDWEDVSEEEGAEGDDDEDDLPPAEQDAIYQNGHELILPSGVVVGHRSMARYYRQNLAPERILSEGQGTVIAAETRHMLNVKDREVLATQKRAWSREKKRDDINDRRAAKFVNNQPYYRDQLLQ